MINYIKGDLFNTPDTLIVHGCNALGVMGAGVARVVKQLYPHAFIEYEKAIKSGELSLGQTQFVRVPGSPTKIIGNAITQGTTGVGVQISYEAIATSMKEVKVYMTKMGLKSVSMPKIGAGLGGGDWNRIEAIIERELNGKEVNIYVID